MDPDNMIYDEADDIYYINEFAYEITDDVSFEMPMAGGLTNPKVHPLYRKIGEWYTERDNHGNRKE